MWWNEIYYLWTDHLTFSTHNSNKTLHNFRIVIIRITYAHTYIMDNGHPQTTNSFIILLLNIGKQNCFQFPSYLHGFPYMTRLTSASSFSGTYFSKQASTLSIVTSYTRLNWFTWIWKKEKCWIWKLVPTLADDYWWLGNACQHYSLSFSDVFQICSLMNSTYDRKHQRHQ